MTASPSAADPGRCRVAIVYPYVMHYREPLFRLLTRQQAPDPEYTIVSAATSNLPSIKTANPAMSMVSPDDGGLRWKFIRNFFIGPFVIQSGIIRLALSRDYSTLVFLGEARYLSTWIGALLARLSGKRVLMWTHGFLRNERTLRGFLRLAFYRMAHGLLLYGNRPALLCHEMGIDKDRLYVLFNSLDHDAQVEVRRSLDVPGASSRAAALFTHPEWPILIAVCRLTAQKQLDLLLIAAHRLSQRGQDVNVLLVGGGPMQEALQKLAAALGIADRVTFLGPQYDERELGRLFHAAAVCVMPGEVGLTAIHSLVYGTPIITHDQADLQMPEFEAIIPGETGDLFRWKDPEDLADKIRSWMVRTDRRAETRARCHAIVDRLYNPRFQRRIMNEAVTGTPASRCPAGVTSVGPLFPENIAS